MLRCTSDYFWSWKQTLWTLIRMLLREQSDMGPQCLKYSKQNPISEQTTIIVDGEKRVKSMKKTCWIWEYWSVCWIVSVRVFVYTLKPVQNGHTQKDQKLVFKTMNYPLMQVKSIAECSKGSILQYFWPSLSYHLSLRSLFCLFLSDHFTQVLLQFNPVFKRHH